MKQQSKKILNKVLAMALCCVMVLTTVVTGAPAAVWAEEMSESTAAAEVMQEGNDALTTESTEAALQTEAAQESPAEEEYTEAAIAPAMYDDVSLYAAGSGLTPLSTKLYMGYKDESLESLTAKTSYIHPLYVMDDDGPVVAYCYNASYNWPFRTDQQVGNETTIKNSGYFYRKVENANAADMNAYSLKNDPNMRTNVLRTIYNGYPYDANGIKGYYGLTNMQFRAVTQAAVWHFTDNQSLSIAVDHLTHMSKYNDYGQIVTYGPYFDWTTNMTNAYNMLIGTTYTKPAPAEFELDLFVTEMNLDRDTYWRGSEIQNLLSTRMPAPEEDTINISVKKVWAGIDPASADCPASVTVSLYANGKFAQSCELNKDNGWTYTFKDLPEKAGGTKITYTVDESYMADFAKSIQGNAAAGFVITNTKEVSTVPVRISKTDINGTRELAGASLVIKNQSGTTIASWVSQAGVTKTVELEPGTYTLVETNAPFGYEIAESIQFSVDAAGTVTVNGQQQDKVVMKDAYTTTEVGVEKRWNDNNNQDGIRPNSVVIRLVRNDVPTNTTVTLDETNFWKSSFTNLRKYDDLGNEIRYTVEEVQTTRELNYQSSVSGSAAAGYVVTNTHVPEVTRVSGTKTWNDAGNQDGRRPASITVALKAFDREVARKTVTEADGWSYSFDNLPKYDRGTLIRYSIEEVDVPAGYQSQINGYNLTNSYTPGRITVQAAKFWNDNNDQDGKRPNEVVVHLYANGVDTGRKQVLNVGNNWEAEFTNLAEFAAGVRVVYTVVEEAVAGYTSDVVITQDGKHHAITNTHVPEVTSVSGTKTWNDSNNQDGRRPDGITVVLKAFGQEVSRKTVTEADGWSYTFDNLPMYKDKTLVRYSIEEANVPTGYQSSVSGYNLTNSYTPGKITVQAAKSWEDNNNQDGHRPNQLTVYLYADGVFTGKSKVLSIGNNWQEEFTDLDEYKDGVKIQYTIEEDTVVGYSSTVTVTEDGRHFTFTNTHNPEKTVVSGTKTWNDQNNQDGMRPTSITVQLKAFGTVVDEKTVTEADGWSYTFKDLPMYKEGALIRYSIEEVGVPAGYQSEINGYNLTNSYTPGRITVQAAKFWSDNHNQDGIRPNEVTVHLYADGVDTGIKKVLNAGNNWEAEFKDLDEYRGGVKIVYSVVEDEVEGYNSTIAVSEEGRHFAITNSHIPAVTEVSGVKTWNDQNDQDGRRPESITVVLKAGAQEIARKVVTEADGWAYSFTGLPMMNNGTLVRYSIEEADVPAGYQSEIHGYNLTNNYTPRRITVQAAKFWADNHNQDGIRPNEVTVHLYADGVDTGLFRILNVGNNWQAEFADLDEYSNGVKIQYSVVEDAVDGYEVSYAVTAEGRHYAITNTHTPEVTEILGTKTWNDNYNQDGKRPESITVVLKAGAKEIARTTATEADGWKYKFSNLPKYSNGSIIRYSIEEANVPAGYQSSIYGYDLTNSYTPGKITVQAAKFWADNHDQDGIRPESITVHLYADGVDTGITAVLNAGNNWEAEFAGLDEYKGGVKIQYSVTEDNVEGYTSTTVVTEEGKHYAFTNTHTPARTEVSGTKTWDDQNNQDGRRPESITVLLKAFGQVVAQKTVTEADGWSYSFTGLEKYKNGTEIRYSVEEADVPAGYQSEIRGFDLVNHYTPGKIAVQAAKSWQDNNDQDGIRPDEITVRLYANGAATGESAVLNADNNWTAQFSNLDEYADGVRISYSVVEDEVEGYDSTVAVTQEGRHFAFTNTHNPEKVSISGTKTWMDNNDQDGLRPAYIIVELQADGVGYAAVKVTAEDDWKYSFDNMPKYSKGREIVYSVVELKVPDDYQSEVNGFDIVNRYTPGKVSVNVIKTWIDNNNQDGIRPEEIVVHLYADDVDTGKTLTLKAEENWSGSFADLDQFRAGTEIRYTVKEDAVPGYISSVEEKDSSKLFTVCNTHVPETVSVQGSKIWEDQDDLFAQRPESINIVLMADGESCAAVKVTEADGWKWSFDNLPKFKDGIEIAYTVQEEAVQNYTAKISGNAKNGFTITNTVITKEMSLSKQDILGKELPGASIQLIDAEGTVRDAWTSGNKPHKFTVVPGTYTLKEIAAPDGYEIATDITFTVDEEGNVTVNNQSVSASDSNVLVMVDDYSTHKVVFSKQDVNGKELAGATIQLKDKDGNLVDEWVSDGNAKTFELAPGSYRFIETAAPDGYEIATEIKLEVGIDGTIRTSGTTVKGMQENMIVMVDNYKKEPKGPDTGDHTRIAGYAVLMGVAIISLIGTTFYKKKKES